MASEVQPASRNEKIKMAIKEAKGSAVVDAEEGRPELVSKWKKRWSNLCVLVAWFSMILPYFTPSIVYIFLFKQIQSKLVGST